MAVMLTLLDMEAFPSRDALIRHTLTPERAEKTGAKLQGFSAGMSEEEADAVQKKRVANNSPFFAEDGATPKWLAQRRAGVKEEGGTEPASPPSASRL